MSRPSPDRSSQRSHATAAGGALAVLAVGATAHGTARIAGLYVAAGAVLALALLRAPRVRPSGPGGTRDEGWRWLLAGLAGVTAGGAVRDLLGPVLPDPLEVGALVVFALSVVVSAPLIVVGYARVIRRATRERDAESQIDAAIVFAAAAAIGWGVVIAPALRRQATGDDLLLAGGILAIGLTAVWFSAQLVLTAQDLTTSDRYLLAAGIIPLVGALSPAWGSVAYDDVPHTWIGVVNFLTYSAVAAAATHPSAARSAPPRPPRSAIRRGLIVAVAAGLLVPAAIASGQRLAGRPIDVVALAVASTAITALVAARIHATLRRLGRETAALDAERRHFRAVVANVDDPIVVADRRGICSYLSPAAEQALGSRAGEPLADLVAEPFRPALAAALAASASAPGGVVRVEVGLGEGTAARWFEVAIVSRVDDGATGGIVTNWRDVTDRRRTERRLTLEARYDALTGAANRTELDARFAALRAGAGTRRLAVLFADLDGLKAINDTLGHDVGDAVLTAVAQRMHTACRATDVVARVGGDEFVVVMPDVGPDGAVVDLARRIHRSVAEPLVVGGLVVRPGLSIGVATGTVGEGAGGDDPDELLAAADEAMYAAKRSGGGVAGAGVAATR